MTSIEIAATAIGTDTQEAAELRMVGNHVVNIPKTVMPNVTNEQVADIKQLGKVLDKNGVATIPADKGWATVMMRHCDYEEKMETHVINLNMLKLQADPMEQFGKDLMDTLEAFKPIMNEHTIETILIWFLV